jgi:hypothetical protein
VPQEAPEQGSEQVSSLKDLVTSLEGEDLSFLDNLIPEDFLNDDFNLRFDDILSQF